MKEFIIHYWLEVAFGVAVSSMGYIIKGISKKMHEQDSLKMGLQALLRDRIIQSYNHYNDQGYVPIYARENLDELSKEYFNLGGNGVVHQLMDKLEELPTSKSEV